MRQGGRDCPGTRGVFPPICIGGGFLLGKPADDYRSILPVVSLHMLIILTTSSGGFDRPKIVGTVLVIVGWIVIEQIWKKKRARDKAYRRSQEDA